MSDSSELPPRAVTELLEMIFSGKDSEEISTLTTSHNEFIQSVKNVINDSSFIGDDVRLSVFPKEHRSVYANLGAMLGAGQYAKLMNEMTSICNSEETGEKGTLLAGVLPDILMNIGISGLITLHLGGGQKRGHPSVPQMARVLHDVIDKYRDEQPESSNNVTETADEVHKLRGTIEDICNWYNNLDPDSRPDPGILFGDVLKKHKAFTTSKWGKKANTKES